MDLQIQFQTSFWGYRKNQVHEYLSELKRDYEAKKEELAAKHRDALSENKALAAKLQELASDLERYREQEHLIAKVLIEAQLRAVAIEHEAQEKAERIKKEVMDEIALKRTELNSLKTRVEQFKDNFAKMLDSCKASLSVFDQLATEEGEAVPRVSPGNEARFSTGL
ncbi:MAG: DivIVA domain-containing protein [Bacillota bacterium]